MIFAAGLGTRMRPLTERRPKAMVSVAGRPLIDHALAQVDGPVVVNTHHFADQLKDHLGGRPDVTMIHEDPLLETGGGLRNALPLLPKGPVMTLNSDSVWTGTRVCDTLRCAWNPARMDGLLLMVPEARAVGRGGARFAMAADGALRPDPTGLVTTGVGIVKPEGLLADPREVFSLRDLWFSMMDRGRLHGVEHPGRWADVGSPEAIPLAEAMLSGAP